MGINPDLEQESEIKNVWQIIRWRMNVHRITPQQLSSKAGYPRYRIERGLEGEPIEIEVSFLHDFAVLCGLISGRTKHNEGTVGTREEYVKLLKPPSAMPPHQGNFWEY